MKRSGIRGSVIPGIDRPFYVPTGPGNCPVGFFKCFRFFCATADGDLVLGGHGRLSRIPLRCIRATFGYPGFRYAASRLRLDFFFPGLWALDMAWCVATGAYLLALNKTM